MYVFCNVLSCVKLLFLQKLLLINICHLSQEAVMTSILRGCPNPRKHFLMTPYFEISWPVKCFIMTPPQRLVYTASSYSRKFYKFYALFDIPSNLHSYYRHKKIFDIETQQCQYKPYTIQSAMVLLEMIIENLEKYSIQNLNCLKRNNLGHSSLGVQSGNYPRCC